MRDKRRKREGGGEEEEKERKEGEGGTINNNGLYFSLIKGSDREGQKWCLLNDGRVSPPKTVLAK